MRPFAHRLYRRASLSVFAFASISAVCGAARAQEQGEQGPPHAGLVHDWEPALPPTPPAPPPPPAPQPSAQPLPPNIRVSPQGDVTVTRTPERGVDVHAQTTAGTVHAYGCNRVSVDPRTAPPAAPCTAPYPYYPQHPAYAPPAYYYPQQPAYAPPAYYVPDTPPPFFPDARPRKPKHPPDPARKAALIASSLIFGIGTVASGTAYLVSAARSSMSFETLEPSKPALAALGTFMTITPSVPRFVVGDIGFGILFTALRGGSFAAGALIDWDDESNVLPVTMAFVVPLTLGIVDLVTTPHRKRKQIEPVEQSTESASLKLHGIAPTVAVDQTGALVPAVGVLGSF
jgi:hypothetical protein